MREFLVSPIHPVADALQTARIAWEFDGPLALHYGGVKLLECECRDGMTVEICHAFHFAGQHPKRALIHCDGRKYELNYYNGFQLTNRMLELEISIREREFQFLHESAERRRGDEEWWIYWTDLSGGIGTIRTIYFDKVG
jgi:hypothetical protein